MQAEPKSHPASPVLTLDAPVLVGRNGAFTTRGEAAGWAQLQVCSAECTCELCCEPEREEKCGTCDGHGVLSDCGGQVEFECPDCGGAS